MLCKKSLNNISLGYGQQTVKMQVCLVKTSFFTLSWPTVKKARCSALLEHKFTHFAYHTKVIHFGKGWLSRIQQYILNSLFPLVVNGGKEEEEKNKALFFDVQRRHFVRIYMCRWESSFKSFLSCVSHLLSVASGKNGVISFKVAKYSISS